MLECLCSSDGRTQQRVALDGSSRLCIAYTHILSRLEKERLDADPEPKTVERGNRTLGLSTLGD